MSDDDFLTVTPQQLMFADGTGVSSKHSIRAAYLRELARRFSQISTFDVGDLVRWKQGLRNLRRPEYDEPAIVLAVLGEAIVADRRDPTAPDWAEPLDLRIGVLDEDGDLVALNVPARRFARFDVAGTAGDR